MARKYAEVRSHCDISVYILILHSRVRPPTIYQPLLYLRHMLTPYTETEKLGLQRTKWFENQGRGYHSQHSTQPQTIGYSLADSPLGLLSWIYEKLVNWSDSYPWDDDEGE